jgi:oligosaccharide reducing-end xylanase
VKKNLWKYRLYLFIGVLLMVTGKPMFAQDDLPPVQPPSVGAIESGTYRNLFAEWGKSPDEIQAKVDAAWNQLFYGDDSSERVYYPVGDDMAYITDAANEDVRTEGMSYGMMIAVQLDKKEEFDRLWTWTKKYMYHPDGAFKGYFSWHTTLDGTQLDNGPASDGEEWFATALFFAANRWGNGEGIYNYQAEANAILDTALHTDDRNSPLATNMFDAETKMVVFVPKTGQVSSFTDPSYHLPHYYELWSRWADADNDFWKEAAQVSRDFWHTTADPKTGLMPDYAKFTGEPQPWGDYGEFFAADAWRNAMNVAVDYSWFAADDWQIEQSNRLLEFFYDQGMGSYTDKFTIDGSESLSPYHSEGLVAMNAVAALAATTPHAWDFVAELWNTKIPSGQYRYYNGLLYMMAMMHLSGQFQIINPK